MIVDIGLILLKVLALFMALTFHEFAHGWVARRLGDHTAESQGRLTLNPKDHIDPFGTVLLPAMLILMKSPVVFGWAKPVPIDPRNFKDPRRGMMWSALGGPMINLFLAAALAVIFKAMLMAEYPRPGAAAVSDYRHPAQCLSGGLQPDPHSTAGRRPGDGGAPAAQAGHGL